MSPKAHHRTTGSDLITGVKDLCVGSIHFGSRAPLTAPDAPAKGTLDCGHSIEIRRKGDLQTR